MSEQLGPDLLTTHNYISDAVEVLGEDDTCEIRDLVTTKVLPANDQMPVPHLFIAEYTTPMKEDSDGKVRQRGTRELSVGVWTAPQSRAAAREIFNEVPSHYRVSTDSIQHCLGVTAVQFNSRRVLGVDGQVYGAGIHYGLPIEGIHETTERNPIFNLFGNLFDLRTINLDRIARMVEAASFVYGGRSVYQDADIDIGAFALHVQEQTGKPVPASLRELPQIGWKSEEQIGPNGENSKTLSVVTIDDYTQRSQQRAITEWVQTDYHGYVPVEEQHLAEYARLTADGEPTDDTLGLDVSRTIFGNPNEITVAQTAAEARAMAAPLIRAMTNLRRYHTNAHVKIAA